MSRVREQFDDVFEFEDLLEQAEMNANSDFELEFTENMRENYEKYGKEMFLSEKQFDILERIAER